MLFICFKKYSNKHKYSHIYGYFFSVFSLSAWITKLMKQIASLFYCSYKANITHNIQPKMTHEFVGEISALGNTLKYLPESDKDVAE